MKNFIFLTLLFCLFNSVSFAHAGGHFHKGDGTVFHYWHLKDGNLIKGNFAYYKDNVIYVEQEEGIFESINTSLLNETDLKFANLKIAKYKEINQDHTIENAYPVNDNYKYIPLAILLLAIFLLIVIYQDTFFSYLLKSSISLSAVCLLFLFTLVIACKKTETTTVTTSSNNNTVSTPTSPVVTVTIPKTNVTFIDSAFSLFKPAISTRWDNTYFYIASNGIPNHNMMIGITNWQQQVPITQPYTDNNSWSIPLQPEYATTPLSTKTNLMKGAVAIAVNGIPIFNALNNRGEDSYLIGELDNWGGHCGKGDDYHYHAAPLHLSTTSGLKPIAFALDGFAVYGSKEPDGSNMTILDTCHGHMGTNNIYHYHGTKDYPYVVGAMKGKVTLDPATTAPENQIIPQAFTKPVRPATNPLKGAVITDFASTGSNGYLLTYKIGTKTGSVKYSWDLNNKYTYILTDTNGVIVTNTYQR
jgi:hypothetical protein